MELGMMVTMRYKLALFKRWIPRALSNKWHRQCCMAGQYGKSYWWRSWHDKKKKKKKKRKKRGTEEAICSTWRTLYNGLSFFTLSVLLSDFLLTARISLRKRPGPQMSQEGRESTRLAEILLVHWRAQPRKLDKAVDRVLSPFSSSSCGVKSWSVFHL